MNSEEIRRQKLKDGGWDMTILTTLDDGRKRTTIVKFVQDEILQEHKDAKFAIVEKNLQDTIDETEQRELYPDMLSRIEVEELLVEKKIITVDEKFEDLKLKEINITPIDKVIL
jgi:hypothetical protein